MVEYKHRVFEQMPLSGQHINSGRACAAVALRMLENHMVNRPYTQRMWPIECAAQREIHVLVCDQNK